MAVSGYQLSNFAGDYPNITLVEEYMNRVIHQAQQTEMKLEGKVTPYPLTPGVKTLWVPMSMKIDGTTGKEDTMSSGIVSSVMGSDGTDINAIGGRYQFTQNQVLETRKRQLQSTRYQFNPLMERVDAESRFANINDVINHNAMARWNRYRDSVIISALGASVTEGYDDSTDGSWQSSSVSFLTGQIVDSAGNDPMSSEKIEDVIELFDENDVDLQSEMPILLVGPKQKKNLRSEEVLINYDYNSSRPLQGNQLPSAMGFQVIVSTQLPTDDTTGARICYAFLPSAIIMGEWEDMYSSISIRNDRNDAIQMKMEHESGAVRVDDYKVVKILCNEASGV